MINSEVVLPAEFRAAKFAALEKHPADTHFRTRGNEFLSDRPERTSGDGSLWLCCFGVEMELFQTRQHAAGKELQIVDSLGVRQGCALHHQEHMADPAHRRGEVDDLVTNLIRRAGE